MTLRLMERRAKLGFGGATFEPEGALKKGLWLRRILLTTALVYGLNALVLLSFLPQGQSLRVESYRDAQVELYEHVSVGVGPLRVNAGGYVNMASSDRSFYLSQTVENSGEYLREIARRHEYFHLIQRDLIAEQAGGTPSFLNPLQSAIYYFQLIRLNGDLAALMPPPESVKLPLTGGLESSADCYAQPRGSESATALYRGVYIEESLCSPAQVWVVDQMERGEWPTAPPESAELPELFVEAGAPGKQLRFEHRDKQGRLIWVEPVERLLVFYGH